MAQTVLFNRYRLLEPAGSGGSAQVWRALDTETGEEVAVKRLHPIVFADEAGRHRLEREFRALSSLDEPHIVKVRDLRISDDEAALVLDYVAGPSVSNRLADGPPFDIDEALSIVSDVAAALAAAHAAGLVHRDVTPGNILLDPGDGARLTDFGIALGGADATAVTATGQLMGTLRYLAPEQLRGAAATPATDLHALAAVAYELLSGRAAYPATTPVSLAEAQAAGPQPLVGLPPGVDAVVRRGLATDPADRPADVRAFAADLRAAVEGAQTVMMAVPFDTDAGSVPGASGARALSTDPRAPLWTPAAAVAAATPIAAVAVAAAAAEPATPAAAVAAVGPPEPVAPEPVLVPVTSTQPRPVAPRPAATARPAATTRSRRRRLSAPVLGILALLVAGSALAGLAPRQADFGPGAFAAPTRTPLLLQFATPTPSPTATPEPSPTPEETPEDHPGKGDENGKGNGKGGDD